MHTQLKNVLESVAEALVEAAPLDAEIIVVDNASTDDTSEIIKTWATTSSFPVQALMQPQIGLSASRNMAIRHAKGDVFVFIDDDCQMSKTHIQELLRYDADDAGLVLRGGTVKLGDPTDLPLTTIEVPNATSWHISQQLTRHKNLGDAVLGCNTAMRREVVERIGMFDENLGPGTSLHAGEDPDFVFRAYLAGITISCVPDMVVLHHHGRKTAAEGKRLFKNYTIGGGALYAKYLFKHPNFCRPYYWDMKHLIKEIGVGKNTFMPSVNFSYKDKIFYSTLGAIMYISLILSHQFSYPIKRMFSKQKLVA